MKIGYVGLGNMGGRLARRLQLQVTLSVYDRSEAAVADLVGQGAIACASAAEVAAASDVVFLCLPTSDHVRTVIFGEDGIASTAKPGTIVVDQTTGDPTATRDMAEKLKAQGITLLDAPVSGGPMGADAGTIAIMVGAPDDQYASLAEILRIISPNVFHAGDVGTGHVMKLCNNLLSSAHRAVSCEAMALAAKNGVDPSRALDIILAGSGRNFFLEMFGRSHILSGDLATGFTLGLAHKDVRLATRLGEDSGVPMYVGNTVKEFFQLSISDQGYSGDVNSVAVVMDNLAGTHVVGAAGTD